jgi:hypothetical protein
MQKAGISDTIFNQALLASDIFHEKLWRKTKSMGLSETKMKEIWGENIESELNWSL